MSVTKSRRWIWVGAGTAAFIAACVMEGEYNDTYLEAFYGNKYVFSAAFQGGGTVGETPTMTVYNVDGTNYAFNVTDANTESYDAGPVFVLKPVTDHADHWLFQADNSIQTHNFSLAATPGTNQCVRMRVRRCTKDDWHPERAPAGSGQTGLLQYLRANRTTLQNPPQLCDAWHLFYDQVICSSASTGSYPIPDGDGIIDVVFRDNNGVANYAFQLNVL